jgi:hypothetical protein
MIDTFNIPDNSLNNQIFYSTTSGSTSWQIWQKPNGVKFVNFFLLSGGGGGGGGRSGTGGGAGAGGGGGSSSITSGLFPASFLPDTLFIQVGNGGLGGSAGVAGGRGGLSYVSIIASATTNAIIMQSGGAGPTGGGTTTSTPGGIAGTAGTVWTYTNHIFPQLGQITTLIGVDGGAGGSATVAPTDLEVLKIVTGGGGGGGTLSTAGGTDGADILNTSFVLNFLPTISGGTSGATGVREASSGYIANIPSTNSSIRLPFINTGGAGGYGSSATSNINAGGGGAGGYGCGGGGGGGAFNSGRIGGSGGRGGDGIVMITCW